MRRVGRTSHCVEVERRGWRIELRGKGRAGSAMEWERVRRLQWRGLWATGGMAVVVLWSIDQLDIGVGLS